MRTLVKAVSTISDGNMSWAWGEKEVVKQNREKFFRKHGLKYENSVFAYLTHGTDIQVVEKKDGGQEFTCDGLVTTDRRIVLGMCAADCLPVILADEKNQVLAVVHLGWRGVDGYLIQKMIQKMTEIGAHPTDIRVWIGPGVRKETYIKYGEKLAEFWQQVRPENAEEWEKFLKLGSQEHQWGVDLVGYVIKQVQEMGIKEKNIEVSPVDTIKDKNYFSHYRTGKTGEPEGRFVTVAAIW